MRAILKHSSATRLDERDSLFDRSISAMTTERDQTNNSTRGSLRLAPNVEELEEHKSKLPRQFVNFTFYRARPEWRILADSEKKQCRDEFVDTVEEFRRQLLVHSYSTIGLRTNVDFMI